MVDAAVGEIAHRRHRIDRSGVDGVRGTEATGELELAGMNGQRDDAGRAGQLGALDAVQPDAATADHRYPRTWWHSGGVEHCPESGRHRTAHHRGDVEWDVL